MQSLHAGTESLEPGNGAARADSGDGGAPVVAPGELVSVPTGAAAGGGSLEALALLVDVSPVGVAIFDREMRFVALNAEYARISRFDPVASRGRSLYEVAPSTCVRRAIHARALAGESLVQANVTYQFPDDPQATYVDVNYRPLWDGQGAVIGLLTSVVDVTDRVRAQARVEAEQARLQAILATTPVGLVRF
jgi:PAS domain S-box-containing protein